MTTIWFILFSEIIALYSESGCTMAQAVNRWSLTAEARIRTRVSPCGICGG
jgi:hypothetical protein